MAAEVAAVLRDQLAGRWLMGIAVALGAVIVLLAVVAMANDSVALGVLEAVVAALILSVPASQPRRRRRLAAAERANRDAA